MELVVDKKMKWIFYNHVCGVLKGIANKWYSLQLIGLDKLSLKCPCLVTRCEQVNNIA